MITDIILKQLTEEFKSMIEKTEEILLKERNILKRIKKQEQMDIIGEGQRHL